MSASLGKGLAMLATVPLGEAVGTLSTCKTVGDELGVLPRPKELGGTLGVVGVSVGFTEGLASAGSVVGESIGIAEGISTTGPVDGASVGFNEGLMPRAATGDSVCFGLGDEVGIEVLGTI